MISRRDLLKGAGVAAAGAAAKAIRGRAKTTASPTSVLFLIFSNLPFLIFYLLCLHFPVYHAEARYFAGICIFYTTYQRMSPQYFPFRRVRYLLSFVSKICGDFMRRGKFPPVVRRLATAQNRARHKYFLRDQPRYDIKLKTDCSLRSETDDGTRQIQNQTPRVRA